MLWFRKRKSRTVFVIKKGREVYLIRSAFFRKYWFKRQDYNCPRSQLGKLVDQAAEKYIDLGAKAPSYGSDQHDIDNVRIGRKVFDLCLVIIHLSDQQEVHPDGSLCIPIEEHSQFDALFAKKVRMTRLKQAA